MHSFLTVISFASNTCDNLLPNNSTNKNKTKTRVRNIQAYTAQVAKPE
jgi:hypothetical protein